MSQGGVYELDMARGWNPWVTLRSSPWVRLEYGEFDDGQEGRCEGTPERGYLITLDHRLDRVERRCVLGHELLHAELDMLWPEGTAASIVMHGEAMVDRLVAERMVPDEQLAPFIKRYIDNGEMCTSWEVAETWDVTEEVAERALKRFEDKVRQSGGVAERARLSA